MNHLKLYTICATAVIILAGIITPTAAYAEDLPPVLNCQTQAATTTNVDGTTDTRPLTDDEARACPAAVFSCPPDQAKGWPDINGNPTVCVKADVPFAPTPQPVHVDQVSPAHAADPSFPSTYADATKPLPIAVPPAPVAVAAPTTNAPDRLPVEADSRGIDSFTVCGYVICLLLA
jgi:hypothetical protein